ncbi:hypothetical protein JCGZ_23243 [Jatropha curcas]|uniref:DUF4378 domain-containing protein n=1 Tax=Jatropha curcas TaxID=180498 RepID=A0A067JTT2_JATCU|nr:uncharacterized protein LOC105647444 [Jatropha curcas]XP_012088925.1 uncharacterized protein LOC105647444 [Jatropha curcas]KDP23410.1 hypothetical protein JCGZ_23243 [Jatropha curcas]
MEGERKRSKGGFFHFFDWNGKSRKKLFSNNFEVAEGSKQGKENVGYITKSQLHEIEVDDRRPNSSNRGSSDFSYASSVTSDEGYGTRAPGVVARLMGLDSLPTTSVEEASSTPFFVSSSLGASQHDRSTPNLWSEYNPMDYLSISSNQGGYSWNSLEPRSQKVQNRPIERFQTEILPPKSAKPIPVTHHKLLSPIRNPGFIPTKNAAYIIEAAAKIIDASPKVTMNSKVPSIASSSVPLRIRDLKQKMEVAHNVSRPQRSNELSAAKHMKGQHSDRRRSGSEDAQSRNASTFAEKGASNNLRNKGKSTSLAVEVKSNVQRRESVISSNNNIKKQKEIRSNQSIKSLPSTQKTKRKSESRSANVLRQNSQKQNSLSGKETSTLKKSFSNQPGSKTQPMNGSVAQSRTVNKVVLKPETMSRKMRSVAIDSDKEKPNSISWKKQSVNDDLQIGRSVSDNASFNGDDRYIKCNLAVDGSTKTSVDNRKNSIDVVSFTFTSPVKRTTPNPQVSMTGKTNSCADDSCVINNYTYLTRSTSSFPGLNIIPGDALGALLEQKLQELTNKVKSSNCNLAREETADSSTSSLQNSISTFDVVNTIPAAEDRRFQLVEENDNSDEVDNSDCFPVEDPKLIKNQNLQESEEMEELNCSSNFSKAEKDPECPYLTPVSILEPSFESGSCSTPNVQSDNMLYGFSTNKSLEVEGETELSDAASSISTVEMGRKHIIGTFTTTEFNESNDWELDYVRDVLNNTELKLKDFALDQTPNVITPNVFFLLENQRNRTKRNEEEYSKLERKILFDCVSERLDLICKQTFVGSCNSLAKLCTLFQRKGWWLAEEIHREILGWKGMGDLMVDELVDRDMSTQNGKWLDFNIEAFEEGVEIEREILTSLVDELVSDLLFL